MKILVWHWGRRGAGPLYAAGLADSLRRLPGTEALLSLSTGAEIMAGSDTPRCDLPFDTYTDLRGLLLRAAQTPLLVRRLARRLRRAGPDIAICAMPAALDFVMTAALRRAGIPYLVVVHDADAHPGDGLPFQMALQRREMRQAAGLIALTTHVADRIGAQGLAGSNPLLHASLPPFVFGPPPPPPGQHEGPIRLLCFGRLLPYKGLDLLEAALRLRPPGADFTVRVVGSGPESPELAALRAMAAVTVENRWIPEQEVGGLLAWSDALILSHREASQSGVAAAAIAAGRWVVATRVGGLTEQLRAEALARLCEPTPQAIAACIESLRTDPPAWHSRADPRQAWTAMAADLLRQMEQYWPEWNRQAVRRRPISS